MINLLRSYQSNQLSSSNLALGVFSQF